MRFYTRIITFSLICATSFLFHISDTNSRTSMQDMLRKMDAINKKSLSLQHNIIMKNKEHQRKILARLNKFFKMVENFDRNMKLQPPIHPGYANNIRKMRKISRPGRTGRSWAYLKEPYKLRSKPADSNRKYIIKLRRNTRVEVVYMAPADRNSKTMSKKWCMVKYGYKQGFIPLNLLSKRRIYKRYNYLNDSLHYVTEDAQTTPYFYELSAKDEGFHNANLMTVQYNFKKDMYTITASPYLNIRSTASRYGEVVGRAHKGQKVEVITYSSHKEYIEGKYKPWAKIKYGSTIGWVFSGYLKKAERDSTMSPNELKVGVSLFVKPDMLRVRDEPSDEGCVVTSIPNKKKVKITEVNDDLQTIGKTRSKWVQIEYDEFQGWVFGGFLSKDRNAFVKHDNINNQFVFPVKGYRRITSPYGYRTIFGRRQFHKGIDVGAPTGAPILAAADGMVVYSQFNRNGFGHLVILEHDDGKRTLYAHGSARKCNKGQTVRAGQTIALVGSTGFSTGPHLHFEVRVENKAVNPNAYMHGQ